MTMLRLRIRHWLKASLWIVALLCVLGAIGLSLVTVASAPVPTSVPAVMRPPANLAL